jgi:CO/xanthine dehydrogenase FAD-binding subunit
MRSYLPAYELIAPASLGEALALLAREPGAWKPFAGGTDLMVLLEAGKLPHRKFFSLWQLNELRGIAETPEHITLGALTTYSQVQAHATLQREFPMLCQAACVTGSIATQNRGTLGGNIANASPAADSPPALLAYDAELELVSRRGPRWTAYRHFHTGYKQMDLHPDELLARIRLPRSKRGWRHYYRKVGTRRAQAISKVCFAGCLRIDGRKIADVRIALGSVAPIPLRCVETETVLRGQTLGASLVRAAQAELAQEITPIDDMRSSAAYRLRVAQNLLQEFLQPVASASRETTLAR